MTEFLDLDDLLAAAEAFLGQPPQVRDYGLLEAALARARATVFGAEAYPTLDGKAAALLCSIVHDQGLLDGNKRLGWVATRLCYLLNGRDLRAPHEQAYDLIMAIADGSLADVDKIAATLARWVM